MTAKISVSLPDDVAERLSREENASAWLAEAARARMAREANREALAAAGIGEIPPERAEAVDRTIREGLAKITPELRERAIADLAASMGRPVDEVRRILDALVRR
jgi:hypothetical protein